MNSISVPSYQELEDALSKTTLTLHPSQVHGLLSGMLCKDPPQTEWETLMMNDQCSDEAQKLLQNLYDISAQQLAKFLFEFQLILPADTETLPLRAEALTLWCQGFLTGIKWAKIASASISQGEIGEAFHDLTEIAKMNYEEVVASEEDEEAYMELVEYVRMAVILIYQELHEESLNQKKQQKKKKKKK